MKSVLVGTRSAEVLETLRSAFPAKGIFERAEDFDSLLAKFAARRYDFTFIDMALVEERRSAGESYADIVQRFLGVFPAGLILGMARPEEVAGAVEFVKSGASNYLTHPLNAKEVRYVLESLEKAVLMEEELGLLRDTFWEAESREVVSTHNPAMKEVFERIKAVTPTGATVLIEGETGTGKNLIARLIHRHSPRKRGPFISVHCGAIPPTLIESELFGHEKGAFTGAVKRKLGRFEIAQGGTIFLDEVGTTPLSVQVDLLQILQDRTFTRVGGELPIEVDVRIVAASNVSLKSLCDEGLFRRDLFYRLNVFPIHLPPLRERAEDIPMFVDTFLEDLRRKYGKAIRSADPEVLRVLIAYPWPGNLRELENIIERAYILESRDRLTLSSLPSDLVSHEFSSGPANVDIQLPIGQARQRHVESFERIYLTELLKKNLGKVGQTAADAGITPRQLQKLMRKHSLSRVSFHR